jgi:Tfp pilus assembly protein PilV
MTRASHPTRSRQGFSVMEALLVSFLAALLLLTVGEVIMRSVRFFHYTSVRQQLQSDSDLTMNTVLRALQLAQKSSVVICSCAATTCNATCGTSAPAGTTPSSRIEFMPVGTSSTTAIYQSNDAVFMTVGARTPQVLAAHNVLGLTFAANALDLSRVYISLSMAAPISPSQTATVVIPNQAVRLFQ